MLFRLFPQLGRVERPKYAAQIKHAADDGNFFNFYFSRYDHFCTPIFNEFFYDNSKNKHWKMDFSFDSAHCAYFTKVVLKLRGEGSSAYP